MQVIHSVSELRQRLSTENSVAFVPTMGNLHEGHLDLVRIAKSKSTCVVVSIFVNRLQFDPNGDFDRYPRTLQQDCKQLEQAGVNIVFAPDEKEMYPVAQEVIVQPPSIADTLEGEHRPGHFAGMATVVIKLLNIVQSNVAVFGKKDYQQLAIVRQLVDQLNLPIEIIGAETIRAEDGLALSSRNGYLSVEERKEAIRLNEQLRWIVKSIKDGEHDYKKLEDIAMSVLNKHHWKVDYIAIRQQYGLTEPNASSNKLVVLGAASLGKTRLIDNIEVDIL